MQGQRVGLTHKWLIFLVMIILFSIIRDLEKINEELTLEHSKCYIVKFPTQRGPIKSIKHKVINNEWKESTWESIDIFSPILDKYIMGWRFKNKYPKEVKGVWYNQSVHCDDEEFPIVFDEQDEYIDCEIGLKVPMFRDNKDKLIYYKVISMKSRYGDFLYPSDGIRCNLKRI